MLRKIADTTKANIYFIPSFRQYKLPTFSRGRFQRKSSLLHKMVSNLQLSNQN